MASKWACMVESFLIITVIFVVVVNNKYQTEVNAVKQRKQRKELIDRSAKGMQKTDCITLAMVMW